MLMDFPKETILADQLSDSLHSYFQYNLTDLTLKAEDRLHDLLHQGSIIDIVVSEQEVYPHDIAEDIKITQLLNADEKLLALTLLNGLWLLPHYPEAVWSLGPNNPIDLLSTPTVELGLGLLVDGGRRFLNLAAAAQYFLFDPHGSVEELIAMMEFDTQYGDSLSAS